jgi:DNA-binding HxlR family transcriptional regulator
VLPILLKLIGGDFMRNRKSGYGCPEGCPVEATLDVIGGKWKGVILYYLLEDKKRFNELRRLIPGITQRMLSLQLSELENDGIINRNVYPEVPPRVEYSMTEFGITLEPIITQMKEWGDQYKLKILQKKKESHG